MATVNNTPSLYWKHKGVRGISTEDGVITQWPAALGTEPDQATLDAWEAEYLADQAVKEARRNIPNQGGGLPDVRAELDALKQALLDAGILTGI